ncbi:Protein arginine N-methyltransferase 7 [Trifolium repens]|nr:Protein arginine N-methyltransferase 7 [Trifolium repens]
MMNTRIACAATTFWYESDIFYSSADDSVYLPLLVAKLSEAQNVISSFSRLKEKSLQYLQAAARANNLPPNCIKTVEIGAKQLTMHDTNQKKVDLLIAEPFYFGHDGMLPWQNLRFWYISLAIVDLTPLDYILSEDAIIIPSKGILRACAIYVLDLWKSRCCLKGPCLPFSLWQCGEFDVLSETFDVMEFDFTKQICQCEGKSSLYT